MPGYCGTCNQHYDCHYKEHEFECEGKDGHLPDSNDKIGMFEHDKKQQGWPDDMDEEIWNKHYRYE